jgi:outer membrane protein
MGECNNEFALMKLGISLEQPIYTFGKVGSALELAREAKKAETLNRDITRKETEYNARTMYATVLFFHRIYEISKSSYENAKKNKKALEKRFGFGRVSRYDNLKISSDVASRLPQVMTSKNNLKQAEQRLKAIIGADTNVNLNLTDRLREKFDTLSQKELEAKMLANAPVLKVLEKNININSLITTINKADYYPTIAGFISYEYSGDSNKLPVEKDEMSSTAVAGIVLKANLFDAGKTRGKYKKAIEDKAISELNLKKTLKAMKLELETSISEYNSLQETLEANKKALDLAKASYETSLSNFSTGKLTLTQLNDAEIMLTGTKFNLEKTIYSLNTLLTKIHKIAAVPMGDGL